MSVNAKLYRPPFVTQRGIDSTLDDCLVVATIHGVADATSGESVTMPRGQEMGKAALQGLARQMRRSLLPPDKDGLTHVQAQQMVEAAGYPAPKRMTLTFAEVLEHLAKRSHSFSIAGNPIRISGDSPVKRCDCAHEWFIWGSRERDGQTQLLYYDGLRPAKTRQRGEWGPAKWLREMAYKSDGELQYVLAYPVGGWTAAKLAVQRVEKTLVRVEEQRDHLRDGLDEALERADHLEDELEECRARATDCSLPVAAALEHERVTIRDIVDARRSLA